MTTRFKNVTCALALGALTLFCSGAARAQGGTNPGGKTPGPQESDPNVTPPSGGSNYSGVSDSTFAKDAAQGGMAEVKLGQLAEERGSSQEVKNFGRRMVEDHSKANDQLKQTAATDNITLPSGTSMEDRHTYDQLSKLSGAEFDRAYANDMVRDHEKDISAFQKEAQDGHNRQMKDFASQTLPTLQDHLRMAKRMQEAVGAKSGSGQ